MTCRRYLKTLSTCAARAALLGAQIKPHPSQGFIVETAWSALLLPDLAGVLRHLDQLEQLKQMGARHVH